MSSLPAAVVEFGGALRAHGLAVTVAHLSDAVRALDCLDLLDRQDVYLGLKSVLVSRIEEEPAFDRCFEAFWTFRAAAGEGMRGLLAAPASPRDGREVPPAPAVAVRPRERLGIDTRGSGEDAKDAEPLGVPAMSDSERLMDQDFSSFPADQLDEVLHLAVRIARRLASRLSRRRRPVHGRGVVDLRRTVRANLTRGEMVELRRRERKRKKIRLVLLCDVSGSMDLYSRFLLQFLYALQNVFGRVETFTFSTRLTRVTDHLKGRPYRQALGRLVEVRHWSGGTRIGESFADFNREWGTRLLDRRTVVIILSDGWDTGDPDLLAGELLTMKRRAGRLIWLNPLLGNPAYRPLTMGMAAALPLLDRFAPAHNLRSLRRLAGNLGMP